MPALAKQAAQNHGIADVADEKFVQAEQVDLFGQGIGDIRQRIAAAGKRAQSRVHLTHESMEMLPLLSRMRHGGKQQVDQKGLAAPDATPEVQTRDASTSLQTATEAGEQPRLRNRRDGSVDAIQFDQHGALCGIVLPTTALHALDVDVAGKKAG